MAWNVGSLEFRAAPGRQPAKKAGPPSDEHQGLDYPNEGLGSEVFSELPEKRSAQPTP